MVDAAKTDSCRWSRDRSSVTGGDGSFVVCDDGIFRARGSEDRCGKYRRMRRFHDRRVRSGLSEGLSVEETLKKASAISAAAALREETGFFVKEDMEKHLSTGEIEKIG